MPLSRYQISKKVHTDVIGDLYMAYTVDLEETVFVKLLHERYTGDADLVKAFHRCAEDYCFIDNKNQIRAHEHGQESGKHYLILDYHILEPLEDLFRKRGVLAVPEAVALTEKIARILRSFHIEGLHHGNLTPQNIFVDETLQSVRIADFCFEGFIRTLLEKDPRSLAATLPYYAPEVAVKDATLDRRCDIFAIGALFYTMLVGETPVALQNGHTQEAQWIPIIPPSLQRLEVPHILDPVVMEAVQPRVEKRYQNLSQFINDLTEAQGHMARAEHEPNVQPADRGGLVGSPSLDRPPENGGVAVPEPSRPDSAATNGTRPSVAAPQAPMASEAAPAKPAAQPVGQSAPTPEPQITQSTQAPARPVAPAVTGQPPEVAQPLASADNGAAPAPTASPTSERTQLNFAQSAPAPAQGGQAPRPTAAPPAEAPRQNAIPVREIDDYLERTVTETAERATTQTMQAMHSPFGAGGVLATLRLVALILLGVAVLLVLLSLVLDVNLKDRLSRKFRRSTVPRSFETVVPPTQGLAEPPARTPERARPPEEARGAPGAAPKRPEPGGPAPQVPQTARVQPAPVRSQPSAGRPPRRTTRSATSAPAPAARNELALQITVTDGRQPLIANVYVDGTFHGKTSRQGRIFLAGLKPRQLYIIKIQKDGFQMWATEVRFNQPGTRSLNVRLQPVQGARNN